MRVLLLLVARWSFIVQKSRATQMAQHWVSLVFIESYLVWLSHYHSHWVTLSCFNSILDQCATAVCCCHTVMVRWLMMGIFSERLWTPFNIWLQKFSSLGCMGAYCRNVPYQSILQRSNFFVILLPHEEDMFKLKLPWVL